MGGRWYYGDAFYCYIVDTPTPFRHGMLLKKRMKFPHKDIKLFSVLDAAYNKQHFKTKQTEKYALLLFGFSVLNMSPGRFMELKGILETYMTKATFKGKEKFRENPTFQACVHNAEYEEHHYYSNELKDEEDREEYKNLMREEGYDDEEYFDEEESDDDEEDE